MVVCPACSVLRPTEGLKIHILPYFQPICTGSTTVLRLIAYFKVWLGFDQQLDLLVGRSMQVSDGRLVR